MKNEHKILVTGVGALIGQGICKNLKKRKNVVIFGLDRRATISSLIFCDKFYRKPNYCEDDPKYLLAILDIVSSQKIDLIIPGISVDVIFFDRYKKNFEKVGCKVCVNSSKLISLTNDKFLFYKFLKKSGFLTIPTTTSRSWDYVNKKLGLPPYLLKPRCGEGGQGHVKIFDEIDFNYWIRKSNSNWIIQRIIGTDDDEFTVGTFGIGRGNLTKDIIILKRKLSRAGNTASAEQINDKEIYNYTLKLAKFFQPVGPTNFQFRRENKSLYLLEINPRFSSSTSIRHEFGYNEVEMCIDFFVEKIQPSKQRIISGTAERYLEDIIIV